MLERDLTALELLSKLMKMVCSNQLDFVFSFSHSFYAVPATAPVNVTVRTRSSQSIEVQWEEVVAIDENGVITMFEVRYDPLETFGGQIRTETVNISAPFTSTILTNLEEFVMYNISVRAYTSVGAGPYSTGIVNMTDEAGKCTSKVLQKIFLHDPQLLLVLLTT